MGDTTKKMLLVIRVIMIRVINLFVILAFVRLLDYEASFKQNSGFVSRFPVKVLQLIKAL